MSDPFFKIVKFSVSDKGIPLITAHARYWRGIHSEIMTHRAFSRNARSSRAVPMEKMLNEIRNDPFVPRHWGANQKGMQAGDNNDNLLHIYPTGSPETRTGSREDAWLWGRDRACELADAYMRADYHKQIGNRLLEPFMWIDTLISSTNWANFFALRNHKAAEPHFRDLAQMAKEAIYAGRGDAQHLKPGEWHLPYIEDKDYLAINNQITGNGVLRVVPTEQNLIEYARKISAARCARISYAPFDGNGSIEAELKRYDSLVSDWPVHASPVEHQATPDIFAEGYEGPYGEWRTGGFQNSHQHRNFSGWRQFRAMIPNETVWDDEDQWMKDLVA